MLLSLLWTNNTIGSSEGIAAMPAMEDGRGYLANTLGQVFCIALADGEIIWQFRASSVVYADVITVNDYVIVSCTNGFVYALDKKDGRVIWNCFTSGGISDTPAVQDGLIYAGTGGKISCIDSSDGSELWTYRAEKRILGRPAISLNHLVFGSGNRIWDDSIYCLDVVSREVVWRQKPPNHLRTSPIITRIDNDGDRKVIVGMSMEMRCLDLATGQVDWSFQADGEIGNSPCVSRLGVMFDTSLSNTMYSLDTRTGNLQWSTSMEGAGFSLYEDSVLIVYTNGYLYCLDGVQGTCNWKREISSGNSRMSIYDNFLLLFGRGKDVYCYCVC